MLEEIRKSTDLLCLISGFVILLPIAIFLSLSIVEAILVGIVLASIILIPLLQADLSVRKIISSGLLMASSSIFYSYSTKFLGMSSVTLPRWLEISPVKQELVVRLVNR